MVQVTWIWPLLAGRRGHRTGARHVVQSDAHLSSASLFGPVNVLKMPFASEVPVPLGAILWLANLLLARARYNTIDADRASASLSDTTARPAFIYFFGSLVSTVVTFVLLTTFKH